MEEKNLLPCKPISIVVLDMEPKERLCLISERDIKDGDWYYNALTDNIHKADAFVAERAKSVKHRLMKVEAATGSPLELPGIPNSFMMEYASSKGNIINKVLLEVEGVSNPDSYPGIPDFTITKVKTDIDNNVIIIINHKQPITFSRDQVVKIATAAFWQGVINESAKKSSDGEIILIEPWCEKNIPY